MCIRDKLETLLMQIYGAEKGQQALARIMPIIARHIPRAGPNRPRYHFSEKDVALITYGDSLQQADQRPLQTLYRFACQYLAGIVSHIHFLPFFPYSSDDGFSVIDFFTIDPDLGDWNDVAAFRANFNLMIDWVINHFSARSPWFDNYLKQRPGFTDFALAVDPAADLSSVVRPRALPLLTAFERADGKTVHVWTTFSADQIDLNYHSLDVLEKMVSAMLFYVQQGASILRLDAIAYLWKEIGANCIHQPQTHAMVKVFREILNQVAPDVALITETNVPHAENISYFGSNGDEAQMVYNFTLPPLLLHAFATENASHLTRWAKNLQSLSPATTYFNFTASHDGIGVRPLEGILEQAEIDRLVARVLRCGGRVSWKANSDGSKSPYELNITYIDAIMGGQDDMAPAKFLASQTIQYALPGVPATYIHSLLGSRNWQAGVAQTGAARAINREKLDYHALCRQLQNRNSFRAQIFYAYLNMIRVRIGQPAFAPHAEFAMLALDPRMVAIQRSCAAQTLLALTNISATPVSIDLHETMGRQPCQDLLSGQVCRTDPIALAPFQSVWLDDARVGLK